MTTIVTATATSMIISAITAAPSWRSLLSSHLMSSHFISSRLISVELILICFQLISTHFEFCFN